MKSTDEWNLGTSDRTQRRSWVDALEKPFVSVSKRRRGGVLTLISPLKFSWMTRRCSFMA